MARDGNGRDHKAAGRPDGGQYEEKAGQGLDDDLEEVPTTAESVAPDEGWWASLENDPEAAAGPEAGREPEPNGPAAETGGDAESEDGPWWIMPGDDAPEVREAGRSIMNAPSREAARALLKESPEDFRCAIIRSLPFGYKAALIDLTPDPDERNDPFSLLKSLPYSADDAKAGRLRDLVAKGDVRAAVALTVHGDAMDREWLSSLPMARRPVVGATLRVRGKWPEVEASAPETKDARTGKPEPVDAPEGDRTEPGNDGGAKAENQGKDGAGPADPVADTMKALEGVGDVMRVRAIIARQPKDVRAAVIRAQPFDRISMLADLTGDPDKARGYRSMLDGLPYTKDSPKDWLRDMASRGDVRAAAALAAYGDDDARRWLATLPVGDHRAVRLALRAWTPPEARTTPKPPAASKPASKPEDKAEGKAMASKPAERDAGVRSFRSGRSTARHPARKPPENEKVPRPSGRGWSKSARTHRAKYGDHQTLQLPRVPHKGPTRGSVAPVRRLQVRVELVSGSAQGGVVASSADTLVRRIVTTLHRVQERAGEQVALDGIVGADGAGIATCGDGLLPRLRPQGRLPALQEPPLRRAGRDIHQVGQIPRQTRP